MFFNSFGFNKVSIVIVSILKINHSSTYNIRFGFIYQTIQEKICFQINRQSS